LPARPLREKKKARSPKRKLRQKSPQKRQRVAKFTHSQVKDVISISVGMVPLSPLSYNTLQRSHQNEKKKKKKKRKKKKKEEEEEEEEEDGKKEVLFTYSEFKDVSFPISVGMGPLSLI